MVLHYGKNYTIYRLLKSESDCCIEWNLPDDITVSMSFNMSDSSRLTHEHIVSFDFNTGIPLKNQYVYFTKNETLENLGFE